MTSRCNTLKLKDCDGEDIGDVRDLTLKLSRENYLSMRRKKGTVNKKEVESMITDTFSNDLQIDKASLTRGAKFSWA